MVLVVRLLDESPSEAAIQVFCGSALLRKKTGRPDRSGWCDEGSNRLAPIHFARSSESVAARKYSFRFTSPSFSFSVSVTRKTQSVGAFRLSAASTWQFWIGTTPAGALKSCEKGDEFRPYLRKKTSQNGEARR